MSNEPLKRSFSNLGRQGARTKMLSARHLCIIFGQEEERVRIASSSSPSDDPIQMAGQDGREGCDGVEHKRPGTRGQTGLLEKTGGASFVLHSGQARPSGSALAARGGGERRRDGNDVLCQGG